jgi:hypothetical protein
MLTTIFVPSTFVAVSTCTEFYSSQTLLTMPFFKWDAKDGEPVVNHRFYIFWAITIPLSVFIFAQLQMWLMLRKRRMPKKDLQPGQETRAVPVETSV